MVDPVMMVARYQMAMMEGWYRVATCAWHQYAKMMMMPQEMLHHPHLRLLDVPFRGPDLKDHYGRRAHDVDVERV